jgi:putative MATE family efflux protein
MGRKTVSHNVKLTSTRDWTQGSVVRNLLSLTWPILISQSLNMIGPFIDMVWVGKLGAASVAGVGIASSVVTLANGAIMGLSMSVRALVARSVGAKDWDGANHAARQAFVICISYALLLAVVGILFARPIISMFGVKTDVVDAGSTYLRVQLIGMITMCLRVFTESTLQASGNAMTPMKIGLIFRAVHVVLCPFLVFGSAFSSTVFPHLADFSGWWPFAAMGIAGAAVTNIISQGLGGILGLWVLFKARTGLRLTFKNFRFDIQMIKRMLVIGLPNLFLHTQHHLCTLVFTWFTAPFGIIYVAAHTIWQRVDTISTTIGSGVGTSAGVLGAQNLGANKPERADKGGWLAAGFALGIMLCSSTGILLFAESIAGLFNSDPELVRITSAFMRISAAGYLGWGLNVVFMQFLVGVGDTFMSFLLETLQTWLVQIPLAFVLSRYTSLGVYGIRWAMVIGLFVAAVIFTLYYRTGKWKHRRF